MSFLAAVVKSQNFVTVKLITQELPKCAAYYETVRWRKPRWIPPSASKQFYVRTPTEFDPAEVERLKVLQPRYNTSLRAVRRLIYECHQGDLKRKKMKEFQSTEEEDEFVKLMEENRVWNERVGEQREKRQELEKLRLQEISDKLTEKKLRSRMQYEEKAEKKVQTIMEESKYFITKENLDEEISKMLSSRKDYNFAIDSKGQKVEAEETVA